MKRITILAFLALLPVLASAEKLVLEECPQPVKSTIQQNSREGKIDDIHLVVANSKRLFVVEIDLPSGSELKLHISEAGELIRSKEDIQESVLPEPVRKSVTPLLLNGAKLDDIVKETTSQQTTYSLEIERPSLPDLKLSLSDKGEILTQTEE